MAYDKRISISINIDKVEQSRLFKGKTGKWLNMTIVPTPDSKYEDHYMVTQYWKDDTLPEGEYPKTPILGNGKDLYTDNNSTTEPTKQPPRVVPQPNDDSEDLPF